MPKSNSERSRGRPAKLSRDQILDCALTMIQRSPGQKITMTGVAKALGTAPMSLYTHVQHRDDLMDGIAGRVMGELQPQLNPDDPWEQQVRDWLNSVYDHLSRYPQIVELLAQSERIPASWLRVHAPLVATLQAAGLRRAQLANAAQWAAHQVIGALVLGFARRSSRNTGAELEAALAQLPAEQQKLFTEITPHLLPDNELFPFTVNQVISALTTMINRRARKQ